MRKFKLIKTYPGSLNIGEIVTKVEKMGVTTYQNLEYSFSKDSIENYPEFWEEIKQPLFKTRDGVDIFKGDKYYQITHNFEVHSCQAYDENNFCKSLIIFSSKESAEEYILMNKPVLSLNDIKAMDNSTYHYIKVDRVRLKELVKSKLWQ